MSWGAAAVAERWGGPWAQWFPYPLPVSSRDVPPFGLGLAPATGPAGRLRDRVLRPLLTGTLERASLPELNVTREKLGVRPIENADELFLAAPLLLYMTAEPLEYPRSDWPQSVRMVGPCSWDPPADPPAWLAEIDKPIVLVSTSSEFQDDGKLVTTALEALATEDVQVIATLPSADVPASVPANARVEPFVPHAPILERAACAITHGGAGVTMKALAAGVPVCVVPFGRDQPEVARRVEIAGAGTQVAPSKLNAERLRDAVRNAMTMKEGAARVAAGFEATGGAACRGGRVRGRRCRSKASANRLQLMDLPVTISGIDGMQDLLGQPIGPTEWRDVTQADIDTFADLSGDDQWIHVDVERAKAESPFGTTIAHGNLTLAMIDGFRIQLIKVEGVKLGVNMGWNKVRFPAPVPADSRVRATAELISVDELEGGWYQSVTKFTLEGEDQEKPVCVAESVGRALAG